MSRSNTSENRNTSSNRNGSHGSGNRNGSQASSNRNGSQASSNREGSGEMGRGAREVTRGAREMARDVGHSARRQVRELSEDAQEYLWTPLLNIQRQMARMLDENMRTFSSMTHIWQRSLLNEKMLPKVRVWEDEREFHLETRLPSDNVENMEVTVHNGFMTLKWEDEEAGRSQNGGQFQAMQSSRRTVMVPENADADKAHAICKDGVLEVIVPKKQAAENRGRSIPIENAA